MTKLIVSFRPPKIYNKNEVKHLLKEVLSMDDPFYAPNGKKILSVFNKDEHFGKK